MNLSGRSLKFLSALLSCLVLTNSVLAYAPEANFWKERRSLPLNINTPPALPTVKRGEEIAFPSIPAHLGSIRNKSISKNPSAPIVFHIQDIHLNTEAQSNIQATLAELSKTKKIDFIALEGASEWIDLTWFQSFSNRTAVQMASDYLLKEKKISGPISLAMREREAPPVVGVDDETHYAANIEAVRAASACAASVKSRLSKLDASLAAEKSRVLNQNLKKLDLRGRAYHAGEMSMGAYLQYLTEDLKLPSQDLIVETFLSAAELEKNIDSARVEQEP